MSKFKTGDEIWWFEFPDNYCEHETILVRGEERLLSEFCNE